MRPETRPKSHSLRCYMFIPNVNLPNTNSRTSFPRNTSPIQLKLCTVTPLSHPIPYLKAAGRFPHSPKLSFQSREPGLRPSANTIHELIHMRPLNSPIPALLLLPQQNSQNLKWRIKTQSLRPLPALQSGDSNARLPHFHKRQPHSPNSQFSFRNDKERKEVDKGEERREKELTP